MLDEDHQIQQLHKHLSLFGHIPSHNLILSIITQWSAQDKYYYYSHFRNEEAEVQKLSNLSKVNAWQDKEQKADLYFPAQHSYQSNNKGLEKGKEEVKVIAIYVDFKLILSGFGNFHVFSSPLSPDELVTKTIIS